MVIIDVDNNANGVQQLAEESAAKLQQMITSGKPMTLSKVSSKDVRIIKERYDIEVKRISQKYNMFCMKAQPSSNPIETLLQISNTAKFLMKSESEGVIIVKLVDNNGGAVYFFMNNAIAEQLQRMLNVFKKLQENMPSELQGGAASIMGGMPAARPRKMAPKFPAAKVPSSKTAANARKKNNWWMNQEDSKKK